MKKASQVIRYCCYCLCRDFIFLGAQPGGVLRTAARRHAALVELATQLHGRLLQEQDASGRSGRRRPQAHLRDTHIEQGVQLGRAHARHAGARDVPRGRLSHRSRARRTWQHLARLGQPRQHRLQAHSTHHCQALIRHRQEVHLQVQQVPQRVRLFSFIFLFIVSYLYAYIKVYRHIFMETSIMK